MSSVTIVVYGIWIFSGSIFTVHVFVSLPYHNLEEKTSKILSITNCLQPVIDGPDHHYQPYAFHFLTNSSVD